LIYVACPIKNIQVYKFDSLISIQPNFSFDDSHWGIILKDLDI